MDDEVTMFTDWLKSTQALQVLSYGTDPSALDGEAREDYVRWNVLAATDELHEALAEISWKPWASEKFFHRDQFVGELVDVLHFVANLAVAAGVTDEELSTRYREKQQRNRDRMAAGYTGTNKCPACRRAVDDVGVDKFGRIIGRKMYQVTRCKACGHEAMETKA